MTESRWQTVPIPVITVPTEGVEPAVPVDGRPKPEEAVEPRRGVPRWLVGLIGVVFALATVVAHIGAVSIASSGDWPVGTTWGYVAIGASVIGFLLGLLATIFGWGRRLGVFAMVLSVLANPFLLLHVLRFFGG